MKLATYLSPWLPTDFYRAFGEAWASHLDEVFHLYHGYPTSGPSHSEIVEGSDPLSSGEVDCAVICAPSYLWLRESGRGVLLPKVPIFEEARGPYFTSMVLVEKHSRFNHLSDLCRARWALNDPCSLSGHFSVLQATRKLSIKLEEVDFVVSGGHLRSLELLFEGAIDACAVDSNGLRFLLAEAPEIRDRLKSIATLGPYPAQPFVLGVAEARRNANLAAAFEQACASPELLQQLHSNYGLLRFEPISDSHFDSIESLCSSTFEDPRAALTSRLHPTSQHKHQIP